MYQRKDIENALNNRCTVFYKDNGRGLDVVMTLAETISARRNKRVVYMSTHHLIRSSVIYDEKRQLKSYTHENNLYCNNK